MATSQPPPMPSAIYGMLQEPTQECQQSKYLRSIKRTAIIQIIGGTLLVALGIVAIILMAYWSYYGTAIWTGIVIFILTGLIGICAANSGNKCLVGTYLALTVLGCMAGFALFEMHIFAALFEHDHPWHWEDYWTWNCQPGGYYSYIPNCAKSEAARQTFDALISITGFFFFILCIVSASYGCCAACKCCGSCCKKCCCNGSGCSSCCNPTPPPITAVFPGQGNPVPTAGMQQSHQQGTLFIVQQGPPTTKQYPQVTMPPPGSANQGTASYVVMPPANQGHPVNHAPPSYNVVGQGPAQYPVGGQAPIEEKH